MIKIVDYKHFGWGAASSVVIGVCGAIVMSHLKVKAPTYLPISFVLVLIGFIFTYLQLIVTGMANFEESVEKYSVWAKTVVSSFTAGIFHVDNILELITLIVDKIQKRPDSVYKSIATQTFEKINTQLNDLAHDEYRTLGQEAFDSYINFINSLKPGETYLSTSAVGIKSFWKHEQMQYLLLKANKKAIQDRNVKIERIFVFPNLESLRNDTVAQDEIKKHLDIEINVSIVLEENLPTEEYKRDFGVFADKFVGYLELGAKEQFLGIRYNFSKREVDYALRLFRRIEKFDVFELYSYKTFGDLFRDDTEETKGAATKN